MTAEQAHEIEVLARATGSSDGDLLCLARHCAADETLTHLGKLTRVDAGDMIYTLRQYRAYQVHCGIEQWERINAA
jgi:hypothetical protein